ncbi:MAG: hypothetical protein ACKOEO_09315, partial [Planctomycetaceae bacterium]
GTTTRSPRHSTRKVHGTFTPKVNTGFILRRHAPPTPSRSRLDDDRCNGMSQVAWPPSAAVAMQH